MKKSVLLISLAALLACGEKKQQTAAPVASKYTALQKASWLLGSWEGRDENGNFFGENWKQLDDSTLAGNGFFNYTGNRKRTEETLRMEERGGVLSYIVLVENQNGGAEIAFRQVNSNSGRLVFENPQHDFPARIAYYRMGPDSFRAEVSSITDTTQMMRFFMGRKK